jgi:hypothetical protein
MPFIFFKPCMNQSKQMLSIGTGPDGDRWNGCHYTHEFKRRARAK